MIYAGIWRQTDCLFALYKTDMKICMEDKTTKRIIIIFAVLIFCFCPHGLAEELSSQPETGAQSEEQQPQSGDSLPEALVTEPTIPDEEQAEAPAQEAPADSEIMEPEQEQPSEEQPAEPGQEPGAEEQAEPENEDPAPPDSDPLTHSDAHHVEERPKSAVYQDTGSLETHAVCVTYDLYCVECQRVVTESIRTEQKDEPHVWSVSRTEPTCVQEGSLHAVCTLCGKTYDETLPCPGHAWSAWEDVSDTSVPVCEREQIRVRHCLVCGSVEKDTVSAPGHQWQAVSYTEATCTQDGAAVRVCAACGKEETIILPAYGHTYVQLDRQDGSAGQYYCALCGDVKEESKNTKSHMYYNNTVTSFGPTTRELIGGSVWNRVTPVDLSQEGVFTYPLIASNMYTVGTATLVNEEDVLKINYKLNSSKINVHSESLVVYPDLESLKTGENAVSFDFNSPIDLKFYFGEDDYVIVAITLKADYDADSTGVIYFYADQNLIEQMMDIIQ